jgi:mannose-1-phosphate guanylyltransferase/mannose-1-phosphate guanylyltransferase/mannose-6-phosphate isomerase
MITANPGEERSQALIVPVILAGGSGTRLWPLSRKLSPKQLLALTDSNTLLQNTLLRMQGIAGAGRPVIICNRAHGHMVRSQVEALGMAASAVYLEPAGRNTAPAVGVAALEARSIDPEALILVLPADHVIGSREAFHAAVETAARYAETGSLTTFGIIPRHPETGYGYIRKGGPAPGSRKAAGSGRADAWTIDEFVEKPDLETARQYVASGEYCWNSGMFLFGAQAVWAELERYAPEIAAAAARAHERAGREGGAWLLDPEAFESCPSDSIDYAVMEKTEKGVMIPFDAGWDDLGSWAALWASGERDGNGNRIAGDVMTRDVRDSLIYSTHRLVAGVGLAGQIVVETPDAVLVAAMEEAQAVKHIVDRLQRSGRSEAAAPRRIELSWGELETVDPAEDVRIRRLRIFPGAQVAFGGHCHAGLDWMVTSGEGRFEKSGEETNVRGGEIFRLEPEASVRLANTGAAPLAVLELIREMDARADHLLESR